MFPTAVRFRFPGDKENISVAHGERPSRRNAVIKGQSASPSTLALQARLMKLCLNTAASSRPLLKRVFSGLSSLAVRKSAPRISITILTKPAGTQTRSVSPIREDTQLPAAWGPSPSSPAPPDTGTYMIPSLSYATRTRSLPSIRHADSSSSSIIRSRSPLRITIFSDPAREKARAEPQRPIQGTRSRRNVSAALPTITPKSILKKPNANAVKEVELDGQSAKVKVLLPEVVVHGPISYEAQAKTGVHYLGTGMGTDTTSHGEILGVPVVNSRSRLQEDDLARYYPKEHAAEQIVRRLRSMVRNGSRLAAAQRREPARQWGETTTTTVLFSDLFVGLTSAPASTPPPTGKMPITPTRSDSDLLERSFPRTATI